MIDYTLVLPASQRRVELKLPDPELTLKLLGVPEIADNEEIYSGYMGCDNIRDSVLSGICDSIPNQAVLVHTLALQEAKDSSEIENIITPHADIYTAMANPELSDITPATKEVLHYVDAIMRGCRIYRQKDILSLSCIEEIQAAIERNNAGQWKLPGTAFVNDRTKKIVYEPPMPNEIPELMDNFLLYFNDDFVWNADS